MPSGNDLEIYEANGSKWWDPRDRTFASLRSMAQTRLASIRTRCGPISGKRIIDLGCGGGLYAVPLAEEGGNVIAVDRSMSSLLAGKQRSKIPQFVCADIARLPLRDESADLVILADVVEHVPSYEALIAEAARLLAPRGMLFVSTITRTVFAGVVAIELAERVGLVPRGTHDLKLFVRPDELVQAAARAGLTTTLVQGESPRLLASLLKRAIAVRPSSSLSLSYCAIFRKG